MISREAIEDFQRRIGSCRQYDSLSALAAEMLALLREEYEAQYKRAVGDLEQWCRQDSLNDEDTAKVVAAFMRDGQKGVVIETGDFPCPVCKGKRESFMPGCVGGHFEECHACYGSGKKTYRIKVPA